MKLSIVVAEAIVALSLSACGDGGLDVGCVGCFPSVPPVALSVDVGPDQTVIEGDSVVLQGDVTAALNCYADYEWRQTQGPEVRIYGPFWPGSRITIHMPSASGGSILAFQLTATCNDGSTDTDSVSVFVEPTSVAALCLQAPAFVTTFVWANSGCTSSSEDVVGDTRVATFYRLLEAEPNDAQADANPMPFAAQVAAERVGADVTASVTGMAGTNSDLDDIFVFTPPETAVYEIFFCNDPLVCTRGTISDRWVLELRDQDFDMLASTNRGEVKELGLRMRLDAGLPYYLWVHVYDASGSSWDYNLTILSTSN